MRANFFSQAPPALGVLAVLVFIGVLLSREASISEDLPVFFDQQSRIVHVELVADELEAGVYQFNDGSTIADVIMLTQTFLDDSLSAEAVQLGSLRNGERLRILKNGRRITSLHREWMSGSHRLALGVPLHPDRMQEADWVALPGIGAVMAERIEQYRQNNGDFGSFEALGKVKGIGKKRLEGWKIFFGES